MTTLKQFTTGLIWLPVLAAYMVAVLVVVVLNGRTWK